MKNFLKYGFPVISIIVIIGIGFFMFKPDNTSTLQIGDSSSCKIEYQSLIKQYKSYPAMCIDKNKLYSAIIHTNLGDITMDLFAKDAPKTVNSFVFLSKSGYYDNLTFHRVIPGFVIQGGDPKGNGSGTPGYSFIDEINANDLGLSKDEINSNIASGYSYDSSLHTSKILTGVVAMANSGPNTNGSQFFITLSDQPNLDGRFTPFGMVTNGMDIANKIAGVSRDTNDKPNTPVVIKSIDIKEK